MNPPADNDQATRHISFHWDGEHLFITTAQMQLIVEGADLLALTDLLSRHKEEISRHIQGLPAWVKEEHQQYLDNDDVDPAT